MPDDEIITLETGEQVRVDDEGIQHLIPGPDPELVQSEASSEERDLRVAALRQAQREVIAQKSDELAADPSVPPEKRIY
jgi:hypothetical protein